MKEDKSKTASEEFLHKVHQKYSKHNYKSVLKNIKAETKHKNLTIEFHENLTLMPIHFDELIMEWNPKDKGSLMMSETELFPGLLLLNKKNKKLKQIIEFIPRKEIDEKNFDIVITLKGMSPAQTDFFVFLWNDTVDVEAETILFPADVDANPDDESVELDGSWDRVTPEYYGFEGMAKGFGMISPNPFLVVPELQLMGCDKPEKSVVPSEDEYIEAISKASLSYTLVSLIESYLLVSNEIAEQNYHSDDVFAIIRSALCHDTHLSLKSNIKYLQKMYVEEYSGNRHITAVLIHSERLLEQIEDFWTVGNDPVLNFIMGDDTDPEDFDEGDLVSTINDYFLLCYDVVQFIELTTDLEFSPK